MVFVGLGGNALGPEGNAMTFQERGGDDETKVVDDVVAKVRTLSYYRHGELCRSASACVSVTRRRQGNAICNWDRNEVARR